MKYNPDIHHRRSVRLEGYDYSQEGAYFITICTQNRECLFGHIENGEMVLNEIGMVAMKCWEEIPSHYPNVILHEFIIMPNHIHGILEIGQKNERPVGVQYFEPLNDTVAQYIVPLQSASMNHFQKIIPGSIGAIVRGYKIGVTKWARENTDIFRVFQRNYHEHIIRNYKSPRHF